MFELGDKLNLWLTQPSRWASPVIVILYARQSHVIAPKSGANHHRRSIHVSTAVRRQVVFQSYRFNTLLKHRIGNNIPKDKEFLLLCLKTLFAPVPTITPIYDSYIGFALHLFRKIDRFAKFYNADLSLPTFKSILLNFRTHYDLAQYGFIAPGCNLRLLNKRYFPKNC